MKTVFLLSVLEDNLKTIISDWEIKNIVFFVWLLLLNQTGMKLVQ